MSIEPAIRPLRRISLLLFVVIAAALPARSEAVAPAHLYVYRVTVTGYDHGQDAHSASGEMDQVVRWVTVIKGVPVEVQREGRGLAVRIASIREPRGTAKPELRYTNTFGSSPCQTAVSYPPYAATVYLFGAPGSERIVFRSDLATEAAQSAYTQRAASVIHSVCQSDSTGGGCDCPASGQDQFRQKSDPGVVWKQNGAFLDAGFERTRGAPLAFPLSALASGRSFTMDSGLFRETSSADCGGGGTCSELTETRATIRFDRR
jgi:hypothetical protein